jgi:cation:H+ antiporter
VTTQVLAALILIVAGAQLFVQNLGILAGMVKIPGQLLAIIITPIATELPEKLNSVIWIRQRKDTLALGNISGAMVFQSSILPAIGLLATPWVLNRQSLGAAIVTLISTGFVCTVIMRTKRLSPFTLLAGGLFYGAFITYIFGFCAIR